MRQSRDALAQAPVDRVFAARRTAREERATREVADELLEFAGLPRAAAGSARSLPYGGQRRVEMLGCDPEDVVARSRTSPKAGASFPG